MDEERDDARAMRLRTQINRNVDVLPARLGCATWMKRVVFTF